MENLLKRRVETPIGSIELGFTKEEVICRFKIEDNVRVYGVQYHGSVQFLPDVNGFKFSNNSAIRRVVSIDGDSYPTPAGNKIIRDACLHIVRENQSWIEQGWIDNRKSDLRWKESYLLDKIEEIKIEIAKIQKWIRFPASRYSLFWHRHG